MWRRLAVMSLLAACTDARQPIGPRVSIEVAPLSLPNITDACYDLRLTNAPNGGGTTVWTETNVCSSGFGDSRGAVGFVGPCEVGADNTVLLTMTSLTTASGPASFVNPCPASAPCMRSAPCVANADSPVSFNLTVMREANQGFFDVAVTFADLFCSAKVDCEGTTLLSPSGTRVPTIVVGLACTGGANAATEILLTDLTLDCDDGDTTLAIAGAPGNVYGASNPAPAPLVQLATYRGQEQLSDASGNPFNSIYYNVAFALSLPATDDCSLVGTATASDGPFEVPFNTPAGTAYPLIDIDIPVTTQGASDYACTTHPLGNGPEDGIWTDYTTLAQSARFDHRAHIVGADVVINHRQPVAITPKTLALGPGNTHTFNATGGAGGFTYSVVSGGGSFAGAIYTAPAAPATVVVRATDMLGESDTATITVSTLTIDPATLTIAPATLRTFSAAGGAGGYVFSKTGGGTLVGADYTSPGTPGSATVTVTDSKGNTASCPVTVAIPPTWVITAGPVIYYSNDATNWTAATNVPANTIVNVVEFASNRFVAVGNGGSFVTSTDGINWTTVSGPAGPARGTLTSGNGAFLAGGANPVWSATGVPPWNTVSLGFPSSDAWVQIAGDGYYAHMWQGTCVPSCFGQVYKAAAPVGSNPANTWTTVWDYTSADPKVSGVAIPAGNTNLRFYSSSAGIRRQVINTSTMTTVFATPVVTISDNRGSTIVAMSDGLNAYTSTNDGTSWGTFPTGATLGGAARVRWFNNRFLAVAGRSLVSSVNGTSWTVIGPIPSGSQAVAVKE